MVKPIKKPVGEDDLKHWHALEATFAEGEGLQPMATPETGPFVLDGKLENVVVVQVPTSAAPSQIDAISKLLEEITGRPPLVLTSNVKLLKIKPITEAEAKKLLGAG